MKTKRTFAFLAVVLASAYLLFVMLYGDYVHYAEQKRVNNHSKVIASAMWSFEAEGIVEYLRLASIAYNYGQIIVTQAITLNLTW